MTNKKSSSNKKRNSLGKGLGALLEDSSNYNNSNEPKKEVVEEIANTILEVPLEQIETNPFQPRNNFDEQALQELADSIVQQGIIRPVTLRRLDEKHYQLISGERRVQAARLAGLEVIPAYIRIANDQQMLEMALIENIQRENLNAIEIALSYQRLLSECELKQEELGDRVGKNRTTVNNYLRLLKLPPDIQAGIRDHRISMGHARSLITIENADAQLSIYNRIINEDLSVRKTETLVRDHLNGKPAAKSKEKSKEKQENNAELKKVEGNLSSHFGTKVAIKDNGNGKGEIKIPYVSTEDLNRILDILDM